MKSTLVTGVSVFLLGNAVDAAALRISDINASAVVEIHRYLSDPQKRLHSDPKDFTTRYSWQHMSEFYPTAQITRAGEGLCLRTSSRVVHSKTRIYPFNPALRMNRER